METKGNISVVDRAKEDLFKVIKGRVSFESFKWIRDVFNLINKNNFAKGYIYDSEIALVYKSLARYIQCYDIKGGYLLCMIYVIARELEIDGIDDSIFTLQELMKDVDTVDLKACDIYDLKKFDMYFSAIIMNTVASKKKIREVKCGGLSSLHTFTLITGLGCEDCQ